MSVEEKRAMRFRFLQRLHELTEGNELIIVNMWDVGSDLGWERQETEVVVQYLVGEGLVKHWTLGGGIGITHHGILQYEQARSHPELETEYFPPVVNIVSGDFTGAIVNIQSKLQDVAQFISKSEGVTDEERSHLIAKLNEFSTQIAHLPPEFSEEAEAMVWAASELAQESSKRDPNKIQFNTLRNGLAETAIRIGKSAPEIASVAADLITIASAISRIP